MQLVSDALSDRFERAIIISADSDLAPAIRLVKQSAPMKEIFVAAPPGRFATARDLQPRLEITQGRVVKALITRKAFRQGRGGCRRAACGIRPLSSPQSPDLDL